MQVHVKLQPVFITTVLAYLIIHSANFGLSPEEMGLTI